MIIMPVKEGENIERALKKFKRKYERTGVLKELRRRQYFTKPSVAKREAMQHAIYVEHMYREEGGGGAADATDAAGSPADARRACAARHSASPRGSAPGSPGHSNAPGTPRRAACPPRSGTYRDAGRRMRAAVRTTDTAVLRRRGAPGSRGRSSDRPPVSRVLSDPSSFSAPTDSRRSARHGGKDTGISGSAKPPVNTPPIYKKQGGDFRKVPRPAMFKHLYTVPIAGRAARGTSAAARSDRPRSPRACRYGSGCRRSIPTPYRGRRSPSRAGPRSGWPPCAPRSSRP